MSSEFKLDEYLSNGIDNIIKGAMKASLRNPKESIFIAKYALAAREAASIRKNYEKDGRHIPAFLICSITDRCNLNCMGCYFKENKAHSGFHEKEPLEVKEWRRIFGEATELGISFILIAGGEPFMRQEVIEVAAEYKKILFPIFTNGTRFTPENLQLMDKNRNLLPVISIEGDRTFTDHRRGTGVYSILQTVMEDLKTRGIFFGVSVTVTNDNIHYISDEEFLSTLNKMGCKVVFFVEYVPVSNATKHMAVTEKERELFEGKLYNLRAQYTDMIMVSFPGDEKTSGGCLAAGRGFFHINCDGSAEPCPFSPYSDTNIKDCSLKEALQSPLFQRLISEHILLAEHTGGCVLFEQEEEVKKICKHK